MPIEPDRAVSDAVIERLREAGVLPKEMLKELREKLQQGDLNSRDLREFAGRALAIREAKVNDQAP